MLRPLYPWKQPLPIAQEDTRGMETVWTGAENLPCRFQPWTDPNLASRSTNHDTSAVQTYDSVSKIILINKRADKNLEVMS